MTALAISALGFEVSHSENNPRSQKKHLPQEMVNGTTTRSPTLSFFTPGPTSTTTPIGSCPSTSPFSIVFM
jgi:hypothetical protein